jgi:hypothetical protein
MHYGEFADLSSPIVDDLAGRAGAARDVAAQV